MELMTRAERAAEAARLRATGMQIRQVAETMELSYNYAKTLLYDPDGAKERERRKRYQGTCSECGGPTDGSRGTANAPPKCTFCLRGVSRPAPVPTGRRPCGHCGAYLRAANPGPLCDPCDLTVQMAALTTAGAKTRPEGPVTDAIVAALPGTASQVAAATGFDLGRVRKRLIELATAGRLERRSLQRRGRAGERTEYHMPETLTEDDLDELMGAA